MNINEVLMGKHWYKQVTPRWKWILYEFDEYEPISVAHLEGRLFPLPTWRSLKKWVDAHKHEYKTCPTLTDVLSSYINAKLHENGITFNGIACFKKKTVRVYYIPGKAATWAFASPQPGRNYTLFVKMGWLCKRAIPEDIKVIERKEVIKCSRQIGKTKYYGSIAENMESLTGEPQKGEMIR